MSAILVRMRTFLWIMMSPRGGTPRRFKQYSSTTITRVLRGLLRIWRSWEVKLRTPQTWSTRPQTLLWEIPLKTRRTSKDYSITRIIHSYRTITNQLAVYTNSRKYLQDLLEAHSGIHSNKLKLFIRARKVRKGVPAHACIQIVITKEMM